MKLIICSIYDKATEAYMRPFFAQSAGQAARMFADEVNSGDSPMSAHPEDYALFEIGKFTDHDAAITGSEVQLLSRAHEIQKRNPTAPKSEIQENLPLKNPAISEHNPLQPKYVASGDRNTPINFKEA